MPRREPRYEPPTVDTCGYHTPPPWTAFHVAEHAWFHHQQDHIGRTVRGQPDTRTDLEQMVRAADGYITALGDQARGLRARNRDLTDRVAQLEAELDALNRQEHRCDDT